jgi:HTH-type transcriptional regulator, transcriptional repressor of NAD biosynthesis genes
MKKIVLFGSESTGKTTLATQLSTYFGVPCCPEFVRYYLSWRNKSADRQHIISVFEDIEPMAAGQIALENSVTILAEQLKSPFAIFDTNIETNWLYSKHYFDKTPILLDEMLKISDYHYYVLLYPDVAWVADGLRDNAENREMMHQLFKNYLVTKGKTFVEIAGVCEARFEQARAAVETFLGL